MTAPNEKPGTVTLEAFRTVPLFPEVRTRLEDASVSPRMAMCPSLPDNRSGNANLRTQLGRIARKAGVTLWDKPFVNTRASCATELAQTHPSHLVTKWPGHTEAVAEVHSRQVTEEHFKKAAPNPAQQSPAKRSGEQKQEPDANSKGQEMQARAAPCKMVRICLVHPTGVEPVTCGSEDRCSIQLSYGCEC